MVRLGGAREGKQCNLVGGHVPCARSAHARPSRVRRGAHLGGRQGRRNRPLHRQPGQPRADCAHHLRVEAVRLGKRNAAGNVQFKSRVPRPPTVLVAGLVWRHNQRSWVERATQLGQRRSGHSLLARRVRVAVPPRARGRRGANGGRLAQGTAPRFKFRCRAFDVHVLHVRRHGQAQLQHGRAHAFTSRAQRHCHFHIPVHGLAGQSLRRNGRVRRWTALPAVCQPLRPQPCGMGIPLH